VIEQFHVEVEWRPFIRMRGRQRPPGELGDRLQPWWCTVAADDCELEEPTRREGRFSAFLKKQGGGQVFTELTSQEMYDKVKAALDGARDRKFRTV